MSDERIISITGSNYSNNPSLDYLRSKIRVTFTGNCLKQDKITYTHEKKVNIYIVYEISKNLNISTYQTLKNYLFGAISLTKNVAIVSVKGSDHRIHFWCMGKDDAINIMKKSN